MSQVPVQIKKPCQVDLSTMRSDEKGKFCSVCQTTVVDFTGMKPGEISQYFINYGVTCGTFNKKDVITGSTSDRLISYLQKRRLKLLASLVLALTILASCRTKLAGAPSWDYADSPRILDNTEQPIDTLKNTSSNDTAPVKN